MIAWLRALSALLLASLAAASQRCDPAQISPPMPSGVSLDQCVLLHAGDASTPALRLLWRVSGSSVSFGVNIAAPLSDLGYVALGSSYNGGMKGAELWVARLDGDGRFQLEAFWSRDYVKPGHSSRASKSLTLLGWQSTAQGASWAFTRPVAAWGSEMDSIPLLRAGGDNMIWAIGSSPGDFNYHGSLRGGVRISLPEGPAGDDVQSSDERTLFVRTPATYTSGSPSRYCWSWHQLPSDKKYHITKVKATVANDHPGKSATLRTEPSSYILITRRADPSHRELRLPRLVRFGRRWLGGRHSAPWRGDLPGRGVDAACVPTELHRMGILRRVALPA
jgi:hypothetical protein